MPASSGDPISSALTHSFASSSKISCDGETLDSKLIGSAKRVLLTEIKYEQTSSYSTNLTELKSKYIVLKPSSNLENGEVEINNGVHKSRDNVCDSKLSPAPSSSSKPTSSSAPKSPRPTSASNQSNAVLPSPKRILYPPEKIQLGWQKNQPIGSGMVNMGNTCYLNSTLQALFHVPAFVNWLLSDKTHKDKCETMNGMSHTECLICSMLQTLKSSMENSASVNPIRPHLVYNKLKLICKRLVHGHQEDAHEFLRYLIESMDRSYLRAMQANNLDSYSKETTPLSQIFGGYLRTEVQCLECNHVSVTFQHFQDMLLDIRQSSALDEALRAYFSRERLGDGEEGYRCDKCLRRVAATKQFSLEKPPNVLCIQLKRFGIMGGKNSKHIQVQQNLDLTQFWVHRHSQPNCELNYRLVSLVSHIGPSSNCGHYTAIGLTSLGQFYLFDDSSVRQISNNSVSGTNTYILMYELTSTNPSLTGSLSKVSAGNCTVTKPSSTSTGSVNGLTSYSKSTSSDRPLSNGDCSSAKPPQPSTPLRTASHSPARHSYSGSLCTKHSNVKPSAQASHTSLVPYAAESSDSDSESAATKNKALTPVKNGYAKESCSCAKCSNCAGSVCAERTSVSCKGEVSGERVVNGWHITEVARRSTPDAVYSPPQNWDVIDTTVAKTVEKKEDSSSSKNAVHMNGNGTSESHRKPYENGHSSNHKSHDEPRKVLNGTVQNGRVPNGNGKSWDGNRNNGTVDYLRKGSLHGYGSNVSSWNGTRSLVDREADNERMQQHKRSYDQMYEDDFDQGKVKKVKTNHYYQKNGERENNVRRNHFQEHQNHKNSWHNKDRSHFYRTYTNNHSNNHFRTYQNNHKYYQWRR